MERNFVLVVMFAALIAALGLVPSFQLATGVPISAQSLGVMLAGVILGARLGALAVILLVVLVLLGLPLLAGGRGGLAVLSGPTVGFFLGWIPAAFVAGLVMERLRWVPVAIAGIIAAAFGGIVVLYICGIIGMMIVLDLSLQQAVVSMLPFLAGDAIKVVLTGLIANGVARARPDSLLSRA